MHLAIFNEVTSLAIKKHSFTKPHCIIVIAISLGIGTHAWISMHRVATTVAEEAVDMRGADREQINEKKVTAS